MKTRPRLFFISAIFCRFYLQQAVLGKEVMPLSRTKGERVIKEVYPHSSLSLGCRTNPCCAWKPPRLQYFTAREPKSKETQYTHKAHIVCIYVKKSFVPNRGVPASIKLYQVINQLATRVKSQIFSGVRKSSKLVC